MPAGPAHLAVLGATGAVGRALLQELEECELRVASLRLLATERSAGTELEFRGATHPVRAAGTDAFEGCQLAFFAAGAAAARAFAGPARRAGCAVVDLSPAFRGDPDVPLVLPRLGREPARPGDRALVAIPGAAATHLALSLAPLHAAAGLERVVVTTLQSASGAGQQAVESMEAEIRAMLSFAEPPPPTALPHRIAFNVIPQVGTVREGGATEEELAVTAELRRLLAPRPPAITVTAVRLPVFHAHSHVVNLRAVRPLGADEARGLLAAAPGVKVLDDPGTGVYPMPMLAVGDDAVLVGRIREDASLERGLALVVAGDNLRHAASAAVAAGASLLDRLAVH